MQSLGHALGVLTALGRHAEPMTLGALAAQTGLHRSTVHRMLATFVEYGLVRRDGAHRYAVGLGTIELARAASGAAFGASPVREAIVDLHRSTDARAVYALPQFGHMVCAVASERGAVTFPIVPVYALLPMHSTAVGKAYLAHRPDAEVERYVAQAPYDPGTGRAVTDGLALRRELQRTRRRGYAFEDREFSERGRAVAVPVLDRDGLAVASVALGLPDDRADARSVRALAAAARRTAGCIGDALFGPDAGEHGSGG